MEDENSFPCMGQEEVVGGGGMCLGQLFNISLYLYFLMFNSAQPEWIPFHVYVAHLNNQTLAYHNHMLYSHIKKG